MIEMPNGWTRKNFRDLVDSSSYVRFITRLRAQTERAVADRCNPNWDVGDTSTERLLLAALRAEVRLGRHEHTDIRILPHGERATPEMLTIEGMHDFPLVIERQASSRNGNGLPAAFVIWTAVDGRRSPAGLIVECVHGDVGDRTMVQGIRDRVRVRDAQRAGYTLFQFTKSDVHDDPLECALCILDWAVEHARG